MITHKYTLMCDDVRREDNGKLMLLGLYAGVIAVPQLPFVLPFITFLMFGETDRPGHLRLKFRLQHLESGKTLVEGHGGLISQQPGLALAPIKFGPVQLQAVGAYNFVIEIEDHKDPIIVDFTVVLNIPPLHVAKLT